MSSIPSECFDSTRSMITGAEWSPLPVSSPCFLADAAAPVFPINSDDLAEQPLGFSQEETCCTCPETRFTRISLDERHVFLCFKEPQDWPALVEAADFDRLPRFLAASIKLNKKDMARKTRLTICEGRDGTESSNGDVMIFPDMIRYKGLTHFDVDTFVEEVLVQNQEWISGRPERLSGCHMFVCAHASHDARCGFSGPIIINRLRLEISARGLAKKVFVRPCTHVGGHKYRGNVIAYNRDAVGGVNGFCFAFSTSDDVCSILDELFGTENFRNIQRDDAHDDAANVSEIESSPDHQYSDSCLSTDVWETLEYANEHHKVNSGFLRSNLRFLQNQNDNDPHTRRRSLNCNWWQASWWLSSWEKEDTLAAFAVLAAATSVALAYHLYSIHARN